MLQQSLDETVVWTLGPMLRSDGTAATDLTGSETWAWSIWTGDDQAPAATGSGTLQSPYESALLDITIAKACVPTDGIYRLQVVKNPNVDDVVVYDDAIKFTSSPGTATALLTTCTRNDLVMRQSWVESLQDVATDQSGFAEQRAEARLWRHRCIMSRVAMILESQASRHGPVSCSTPIPITTGYDLGPTWGTSIYPDTTIRDQVATIQGYLDADLVMTGTIDNGQAKNIDAWYALHLIAESQAAGTDDSKPWAEWSRSCRSKAIRAMSSWTAKIDTDDDGVSDIEIGP